VHLARQDLTVSTTTLTTRESLLPAWPRWLAGIAGGMVLSLGIMVLVGAAADMPALRSGVPGWPQMAISTAICCILSSLAIFLSAAARMIMVPARAAWLRGIVMACGCCVLAISGVTLASSLLGWAFNLDALIGPWGDRSAVAVRMVPATALGFVFLGGAMVLMHAQRSIQVFQWLVIGGGWVGWMGMSRYVYGGEPIWILSAMSALTALAIIILSIGMLCVRPRIGLMELLCAGSQGGTVIRQLLPYAVVIPLVVGWMRVKGQQSGWYGLEAGTAMYAMANVALFAGLVWIVARRLHRIDEERQRLIQESLHLAAMVQSSTDAITSKTLTGIVTSWNIGAERLFGYSAQEMIGRPMRRLMLPERQSDEDEILREIAKGRTIDHYEAVRVHKDGHRLDVSVTVSPIRDANGIIIGASNIARDVSERKQVDAKLRAQLARLDLLRQVTQAISEHHDLPSIYQVVVRCLEEQMPADFACVCLYDQNSNTLTVSRVGVNSEALAMGLALTEQSVIPIDRNGLSLCVRGELVYEPDIREVDFPFPRRLAGAGLCSFVAVPLQVESLVVGVVLVARREPHSFSSGECEFLHQLSAHVALATRHSELYTALQRAYDDLRQTQQAVMQNERLRALGQMASGIAHDINNALSPVVMYTEQLLDKETQLSERSRNALRTILRAGEDVATTVGRLREFYRQQDQRAKMSGVGLNAEIQHVIDLTKARWCDIAQQRGVVIDVQTDLTPDLPFVIGVEHEIREALTNLMFNAIDAMPTGGTITLRTRCVETDHERDGVPGGKIVRLEVSDTGVGMNEQTRTRCLEPFFTTKGERGTGLGLAMVYGIVQRHGAELSIESEVGRGTTFRIDFHQLANTPTPTAHDTLGLTRRLRLLLIDDDPIILKALSDRLEDEGHELVLANGGQAGIETFRTALDAGRNFDVVITDLGMPNVDGRRVAAMVKSLSGATPIIMLTGWGQRLADNGDLPPNIDRVLSKPPKLREIQAALLQLTGGNGVSHM
jgi:PAS domain S-box-containing protein